MLKHFNIQGISEKEVITVIVRFMAFQLGFLTQKSAFVCKDYMEKYGYEDEPYLKVICTMRDSSTL
jgi:hypothetical protein